MPLRTAILCRTNAPLVKCAFDLIKQRRGIKVKIIGRDIAKNLKDIIADVLDFRRHCDIKEFIALLNNWIVNIRTECSGDESKESYLSECEDNYGCIDAIASQCKTSKQVCETIDQYFVDSDSIDDDPMTIVFASGHRSKGLEWKRVIWLRYDLCPHPSAELPEDLEQEEHLLYILGTRAEEEMIVCHDMRPR